MSNAELIVVPEEPQQIQHQPAVRQGPADPMAAIIRAVTDGAVTAESAVVLKDLYLSIRADEAKRQFAAAFSVMQAELPIVIWDSQVPDGRGGFRSRFASYEHIMETIKPFLKKHGFAVAWDKKFENNRICAVCTIMHTSGHSHSNECWVRAGQGPPGTNDAQADGSIMSYAKRYALCDALNIAVDKDVDARIKGHPITQEQADSLKDRVKAIGANEAAFLKFAQAASYEEIMDADYSRCDAKLAEKERAMNPTPRDPELLKQAGQASGNHKLRNVASGEAAGAAGSPPAAPVGQTTQEQAESFAAGMDTLEACRAYLLSVPPKIYQQAIAEFGLNGLDGVTLDRARDVVLSAKRR